MGFMDKLKEAAQDVATEAKKATAQGKEKLEDLQTRKKMDEAAKQLGYLVHRERTEGTPAGVEADQFVAEISRLKTEMEAKAQAAPPEAAPPSDAAPAQAAPPEASEPPAPPTTPVE